MFNPLSALGDINKLRQMQDAIKNETFELRKDNIRVVVRGDQKIVELDIDGKRDVKLMNTINDAFKEIQKISAKKLMEITK